MSKQYQSALNQLNEKHSNYQWLDRDILCEEEIIFAVHSIEIGPGGFGPQWKLQLELREDTIPDDTDLELEEGKITMISLPCSPSRDKVFNEVLGQDLLPMYNCFLDDVQMTNSKNVFYALRQLEPGSEFYQEPPRRRRVLTQDDGSKKKRRGARIRSRNLSGRVPGDMEATKVSGSDEFDPFLDDSDN